MKIYLRSLAVCYFIGFLLHALDVFSLRLNFLDLADLWKIWICLLLIGDLWAAIGLWQNKKWGINLFLLIAALQLVAYSGLLDSPKNQIFLIIFHTITLATYFLLRSIFLKIEL